MNKSNVTLTKKRYTTEQVLTLCNWAYDRGVTDTTEILKNSKVEQKAELSVKLANAVGQAVDAMGKTLASINGHLPY